MFSQSALFKHKLMLYEVIPDDAGTEQNCLIWMGCGLVCETASNERETDTNKQGSNLEVWIKKDAVTFEIAKREREIFFVLANQNNLLCGKKLACDGKAIDIDMSSSCHSCIYWKVEICDCAKCEKYVSSFCLRPECGNGLKEVYDPLAGLTLTAWLNSLPIGTTACIPSGDYESEEFIINKYLCIQPLEPDGVVNVSGNFIHDDYPVKIKGDVNVS